MSNPDKPGEESASGGETGVLGNTERYDEWVARTERGRGRQAAISRNLGSLTNYKRWAEKVRGSWDEETPDA